MTPEVFMNDFIRLMKSQADGNKHKQEIFNLLDEGYQFYISGTKEYCEKIREGIFVENRATWRKTCYKVLESYRNRARKQLQNTGEKTWLERYLVAFSIDNGSIDFRDDASFSLPSIYKLARENGIDPRPIFLQVAEVSDEKEPFLYRFDVYKDMEFVGDRSVKRWLKKYGDKESLELSEAEESQTKRSEGFCLLGIIALIILLVVMLVRRPIESFSYIIMVLIVTMVIVAIGKIKKKLAG